MGAPGLHKSSILNPMSSQSRNVSAEAVADFQTLNLTDVQDDQLRSGISASINLMENINRGTVAEVIVAMALGDRGTDA